MTLTARPTLVVFDVDGTLSDSTTVIVNSWMAALEATGLPVPEPAVIKSHIGMAIKASLPSMCPGVTDAQHATFFAHYRDLYVSATLTQPPLFEGTREALERLRDGGIALGVCTSKGRQGLDRMISGHDLEEFFPAPYRASADDGPSKPHPKSLLDLIERTWHQTAAVIMVGDTTFDIEMAHAAGTRSIAVTCGAHDRATLESVSPTAIVSSVVDVPDLWSCDS